MARFWVYIDSKVLGPSDIPSLRKIPGFNLLTQVCLEGEQTWRMADEVIEIKSYFISPPRLNSFALDSGNAAPKLQIETPPVLEELTLPEPNSLAQIMTPPAAEKKPEVNALRAVCEVCGYKNPRDVSICMKCGEQLKGSAATTPSPAVPGKSPAGAPPTTVPPGGQDVKSTALPLKATETPKPVEPSTAPTAPAADVPLNTMVEIPMSKLLIGAALALLVSGGSFMGYRAWKKKHAPHPKPPVVAKTVAPKKVSAASHKSRVRSTSHKARSTPVASAAALPGVSAKPTRAHDHAADAEKADGSSYKVISDATPLQKRYSSPVKSSYAQKRRANDQLWTTQEGRAIKQVQRMRIYGGQRTIERNADILMQILRDREYTSAFENGKRLFLYADADWSAVQTEGPMYEVRLSFSGGKESDGSPRKPLHFAFASDLERGTVEPGGKDQVRSNTLHAFFDESRIAPEERRAIAKDTEELVLAAQPGASPLALDTVLRQFAKVYGTSTLTRVSKAYDLDIIQKKLNHDPRLSPEDIVAVAKPDLTAKAPAPSQPETPAKPSKTTPSSNPAPPFSEVKGQGVDFRMETGHGRERTLLVRASSRASVERVWEVLTGYDRLKQFMPDMLTSEREGQDGAAVIVHTVCLTRFMVFVFKVNLHFRVIEHPQQHSLEFERIAGDFESFRGSISLVTDPATHDTRITFQGSLVPTGRSVNWKLESMARRLLVAQMNALRTKAESN